MGSCQHCGAGAGWLRRVHGECRQRSRQGWSEMVREAADAAGQPSFRLDRLRPRLLEIAQRSFHDEDGVNRAIAEGWHQAVKLSLADGAVTQEEEARLRDFRDRFQIADRKEGRRRGSAAAGLDRAARERTLQEARNAALTVADDQFHLDDVDDAVKRLNLPPDEARRLLCEAWEAAVE